MTPERWRQIRELFELALAADPALRSQVLAEACGDDNLLRSEVDSLLEAHEDESGFLRTAPRLRLGAEPLIGRTVAHYQIHSTLGMGGMGIVYRAFDTRLDRYIALKVLPPERLTDTAREAFVREAKAASALNHPSIVTIHDTGAAGEIHFIAMELVTGRTLADLIADRGLPISEALDYAIQIASALVTAHAVGIVHRDIKPSNIMVTNAENPGQPRLVKILDFGLVARGEAESGSGSIRGTVSYMSPEQAAGQPADARSDIFSFGCTFYEMLTGRRAFSGPTKSKVLAAIRQGAVPESTPDIPPACGALIRRCLRKDVHRRVQSARDLVSELRSIQADLHGRRKTRARVAAVCVLLALALLAAGLVVRLWPARQPNAPSSWQQLTRFPDSVSQPALSLDGRRVTFVRGANTFAGAGQIYVKTLPDGEAVQLTSDSLQKMSPVFSPDGSQVAYSTSNRQNQWDTWVVPTDGGAPRRWLSNASGLTWFGNRNVLFSEIRDHDVHMGIVAAGENRTNARVVYLPADVRAMAHRSYPSPDGKWVLLVEMDASGVFLPCRLVPMDGSSPGGPVGPPGSECTSAAWSPDGTMMYLSSAAGGTFHTWRQQFPRGRPEQITSGPTEEEGIAMDPAGRSFITAVGLRQSAVLLHDANGERPILSEGYSYDPKFTPDGKKLCYRILKGNDPTNDPSELQVYDLESGRSQTILAGISSRGRQGTAYDISPDGQLVVAGAADREGKSRLWLAPLDRSQPPHPVPGVEGNQPLFAKNGDLLFFAGGPASVWRVRQDGTGLQRVTDEPALQRGGTSPDGRWLPVRVIRPSGYVTLLHSLENQPTVPISPAGALDYFLKWSPDGSWIFLSVPESASTDRGWTYAVPLQAGKLLPDLPAAGFRSEDQIASLPGAQRIDSLDVAPGPAPRVYAFARETLLRNLFRVSIP